MTEAEYRGDIESVMSVMVLTPRRLLKVGNVYLGWRKEGMGCLKPGEMS